MNVHTKKHHEDDCVCPDCKKTTFDQDFKEKVKEKLSEMPILIPVVSKREFDEIVKLCKWAYDMGKEG